MVAQCWRCGEQYISDDTICVNCGAPRERPARPSSSTAAPAATTRSTAAPSAPTAARTTGSAAAPTQIPTQRFFPLPPGYPSLWSWLLTGVLRNRRGAVGALLGGWIGPTVLLFAAFGLVSGCLLGLGAGVVAGSELGDLLGDVPLVGGYVDDIAVAGGGPLGGLLGALLGTVAGALLGLTFLIFGVGDATGFALLQPALLVVIGLLYTVLSIAAERQVFEYQGCRRPSRREKALIEPVLIDCARRLGLQAYPALLIDDTREVNAFAGTRHIIITRGFLDEFDYESEPLAAALCHELGHWRNADTVSNLFIRGAALPLYLFYVVLGWVSNAIGGGLISGLLWLVGWPFVVTVKFVIMPLQASGQRRAEYEADAAAVSAGHRSGTRTVLARMQRSFDGATSGWEEEVYATHPPFELRLERIEEPGVSYPLPDPEAPPHALPVTISNLPRD